jgi:hypothetical protein
MTKATAWALYSSVKRLFTDEGVGAAVVGPLRSR